MEVDQNGNIDLRNKQNQLNGTRSQQEIVKQPGYQNAYQKPEKMNAIQHRTVTPNRPPQIVQEIRNQTQPKPDDPQINTLPYGNVKQSNLQQINQNTKARPIDGYEDIINQEFSQSNKNLLSNQNQQLNNKKPKVQVSLEKTQPTKLNYELHSNQIQLIARDREGLIFFCGNDKKLTIYKNNLKQIDSVLKLEDQPRCCLSYLKYIIIGLWNGKINIYDSTYFTYSDPRAMVQIQTKSISNKMIGIQNKFIICGESEGQIEILDIDKGFASKVISKNSECPVLDMCYVKHQNQDNLFVCRYQEGLHLFRALENDSPLNLRHTEELLRENAFSAINQINESELLLACSDYNDYKNEHLLVYNINEQKVTKKINLKNSNAVIQSIQLVDANENLDHKYMLLRSKESLLLFNTTDYKEKLIMPMQYQALYPHHDSMKSFYSETGDTLYILFLELVKNSYELNGKMLSLSEYTYKLKP
ncbi:UNKNOWN [Stylonychia lemnae]|uniref:Uncharacterized protein n=1 Tax=Stylonychia lemnae TaxID=5949 RepID=A0A078A0A7_STYLE|nr:UNKNOWN [Stylonychia lemnae]|eukprot:CDW75631.1 UNKNOWN [Stylonychia lemnae]